MTIRNFLGKPMSIGPDADVFDAAYVRGWNECRQAVLNEVARNVNLPDEQLLLLWRSVSGPNAELTGPLIRYAGLVYAAACSGCESEKNWLRAQRDVAEEKLTVPVPSARFDLLDDPQRGLHAVLTRFSIASRSDCSELVTALVHWAADAYRSSQHRPDDTVRLPAGSHAHRFSNGAEGSATAAGSSAQCSAEPPSVDAVGQRVEEPHLTTRVKESS